MPWHLGGRSATRNRDPAAKLASNKLVGWRYLMDPSPDYDASDEVEYFFNWVPWGLRGVYPPPAYPPV